MSEPLDDMYRDIIMDHYRSPRGKQPVKSADIKSDGSNPACGDELEMQVEMHDGTLKQIHVDCKGCAISVASGSMLAEIVEGRPLEEARRIAELVRRMLKGEEVELPDDLGDLDALKGVRQFPVRIKCALLSWVTLINGLENYRRGQADSDTPVTTEDKE